MDFVLPAFKGVSVVAGGLFIQVGVQAMWNPLAFSESFGLPLGTTVPSTTVTGDKQTTNAANTNRSSGSSFAALMGARQFATGATILIFASRGKWTEVATVLSVIGVVAASADAYNLWTAGKPGLARYHAIPAAGIVAHALAVLYLDAVK